MVNTTDELISRARALVALQDANITVVGMRAGKTILTEYSKQVRDGYIDIVRNVPAAKAEVVRHGEWIYIGETRSGNPIWKCSFCGKKRAGRQAKSAYCRDCGCCMDLGENARLPGQQSFDI